MKTYCEMGNNAYICSAKQDLALRYNATGVVSTYHSESYGLVLQTNGGNAPFLCN